MPVFSLNSIDRSVVAATYMDEFAERHTREMIVRNALGATVPSAGVGTCLTRRLIEHFVRTRGNVLMTGCVTEDYILGVEAKRAGFKSTFAAVSARERRGRDYVATREFFPKSLAASIKQKTRWVYGINFEATTKLGWAGDAWDRYFFVRDRKGAITNFLPAASLAFVLLLLLGAADPSATSPELQNLLAASFGANLVFLLLRYVVRVAACHQVYGIWNPIGIALRWPVGLYVNMAAVWRAWKIYVGELRLGYASVCVGENSTRNSRRSCQHQTIRGQVIRILIAFGTRPEIIKLGPVWQALRKRDGVTCTRSGAVSTSSWLTACSTCLTSTST
ncbi:glycosyltransferase [Bradyrhizobium sp. MOS002]|uniref:glycosyltransferase n=1 Tax=Bradyrhizobium sp. MOS002 TaxID=2133947 RepID=UPI001FE1EA64|nr:glycosyltransferase [Bradyrhizobium sp. MOS002]